MTTWILRQDPALRALPAWLVVTAVNATALGGVLIGFIAHPSVPVAPALTTLGVLTILWVPLWVLTFAGNLRTRCPEFALTLPLPARRVWRVHVIANWLTGATIVAAAYLVLALISRALEGAYARPLLRTAVLVEAGGVTLVAWALVVLVLDRHAPAAHRVGRSAAWVGRALVALVGGTAAAAAAAVWTPWIAVLMLVAGAALFADHYRKLPPAFLLTPEAPAAAPTAGEPERTHPGRAATWRTVQRCMAQGKFRPWLVWPFVLLLGALIGGLDRPFTYPSMQFFYDPLAAYVLLALSARPLAYLHAVDPLPIARRVLWGTMVAPLVAGLFVGYGVGFAVSRAVSPVDPHAARAGSIYLSQDDDGSIGVHVPASLHRVAWNGTPPEVETPWGDSFRPPATRVVARVPVRVYSPYGVLPGASPELVAWQVARAAHALYSVEVSPGEILSRITRTGPDGSPELVAGPVSFDRAGKGFEPRLPVCAGTTLALWFLAFAMYLGLVRVGVSNRRRMFTFWGILAVLFALYAVVPALAIKGVANAFAVYTFTRVLLARAGSSPGGVLAVWMAAGVLVTVTGAFAWRRFRRAELVCMTAESR